MKSILIKTADLLSKILLKIDSNIFFGIHRNFQNVSFVSITFGNHHIYIVAQVQVLVITKTP